MRLATSDDGMDDGFDPMRLLMVVGAIGILVGAGVVLFVDWLYK